MQVVDWGYIGNTSLHGMSLGYRWNEDSSHVDPCGRLRIPWHVQGRAACRNGHDVSPRQISDGKLQFAGE